MDNGPEYFIDPIAAAAKKFGMKTLAWEMDKAESTFRNELSQQPGYKLGLITAIRIMQATGDLAALDRMEELFGRAAYRLPRAKGDEMKPVMQMIGRTAREYGEQMEALGAAIADGVISRKEAQKCLKETEDVINALVEIKAFLEKLANERTR